MAVATINNAAYGKLLARALPRVIKNEEEKERIVAELEKLNTRGRPLTPEDRGLRQRDLIPLFGSSSVVSDVLNGKRSISKAHARKLAESFHVPASLFID